MKKEFSLREKKFAKTKIGLLREFMYQMQTASFDAISIKDVCDKVEVSEGTFYNYFPQKSDILCYYKDLSAIKICWKLFTEFKDRLALEKISLAFNLLTDEMSDLHVFYEMISTFTREKKSKMHCLAEITSVEKYYAFPDSLGIEETPGMLLEDLFKVLLQEARKNDELPKNVDIEGLVKFLMAVLIGTPLALGMDEFSQLKMYINKELNLIWTALGRKEIK